MNKKKLKKLVALSYTKNNLDEEKVATIVRSLSRIQLKQYIKSLKNQEAKRSIVAAFPRQPSRETVEKLQDMYPNKQIAVVVDPSLLLGVKIIANDLVFNYSLKHSLQSIESYIANSL